VLVSKETRIGEIIEAMQQSGSADLEDVDLIDEYSDEKLEGKQSLTFRMIFQAEDRTLSDEEVNRLMEGILKSVRERFYAEIR
jgi:phenylalanyl-tRNA synthetase beta chain